MGCREGVLRAGLAQVFMWTGFFAVRPKQPPLDRGESM
jgi:hypothetical protein